MDAQTTNQVFTDEKMFYILIAVISAACGLILTLAAFIWRGLIGEKKKDRKLLEDLNKSFSEHLTQYQVRDTQHTNEQHRIWHEVKSLKREQDKIYRTISYIGRRIKPKN